MRKFVSPTMVILLVIGLGLTGCATEKYVQEQVTASQERTDAKIGEVQTSVEANQGEISKLQANDKAIEEKLAKLSDTAKDALVRAEEAGKLAKGKFLYEITLTDNDVRFGFNKYGLCDEAKAALDGFASKVKAENKNVFVEIQGHTCNIGSEKVNLELGYKRAEQVLRYLNETNGFALHRMNVISYGEYKPIADNSNRDGRAENRRVTLVAMQ